jgi:hypothetical protein
MRQTDAQRHNSIAPSPAPLLARCVKCLPDLDILIPWSGDEGDDGICGSPGAADARFAAASVLLDLTVRDVTTFTRNRDRLLDGEVTGKFLTAVLSQDKVKRLLSSEHFSVDGTLLGKPGRARRASARRTALARRQHSGAMARTISTACAAETKHASTTDLDTRLLRKGPGKEARLCFMGHALMENRYGLIVGAAATHYRAMLSVCVLRIRSPRTNGKHLITVIGNPISDLV